MSFLIGDGRAVGREGEVGERIDLRVERVGIQAGRVRQIERPAREGGFTTDFRQDVGVLRHRAAVAADHVRRSRRHQRAVVERQHCAARPELDTAQGRDVGGRGHTAQGQRRKGGVGRMHASRRGRAGDQRIVVATPGAARLAELTLIVVVVERADRMEAIAKRMTTGERYGSGVDVPIIGRAALEIALEALEPVVQGDVDDAGHGIGTVRGRCAAGDDLQVLDQRRRDDVRVDAARRLGGRHAPTIDEQQGAGRPEAAQIEIAGGDRHAAPADILIRRESRHVHDQVRDARDGLRLQLLAAHLRERRWRIEPGDARTRCGNDDFFELRGLRRFLRACRRRPIAATFTQTTRATLRSLLFCIPAPHVLERAPHDPTVVRMPETPTVPYNQQNSTSMNSVWLNAIIFIQMASKTFWVRFR